MPDITLPWYVVFVLPYVATPGWALLGALLGFGATFRATRSWPKSLLAAVIASMLLPLAVFFVADYGDAPVGGGARAVGLAFVTLVIIGVVAMRARRR